MNKKIALGNFQSLTYIQKNLTACFYFIKSILPFHEIMLIKQIIFLYEAEYLFSLQNKVPQNTLYHCPAHLLSPLLESLSIPLPSVTIHP